MQPLLFVLLFFFNDTATTEIYTLSLHDALPIPRSPDRSGGAPDPPGSPRGPGDRKSTRLNSSHVSISYAVFCLKKKKQTEKPEHLHHQPPGCPTDAPSTPEH